MLSFGYFGELYIWNEWNWNITMLYQREFLQMEANLGGTNKILFIYVNAKDFKNNFTYLSTEWWSYGSAALVLEDEKSDFNSVYVEDQEMQISFTLPVPSSHLQLQFRYTWDHVYLSVTGL